MGTSPGADGDAYSMDRVYRAITMDRATAKMRADARGLADVYRIGWTDRDTWCPTPTSMLCFAAGAGAAALGLLAWPPALVVAGIALLLGVIRIRDCTVTVTYVPLDGLARRAEVPGG